MVLSPLAIASSGGFWSEVAEETLLDAPPTPTSTSLGPTSGWGEALAGSTIDLDGSAWTVNQGRGFADWERIDLGGFSDVNAAMDMWNDSIVHVCAKSDNGTGGTSLVYLRTGQSPIWVDSGDANGDLLGSGCDIEIDPRGRARISYIDETSGAIKVAREAAPSSASPDWLIRRINSDTPVSGTPDLVLFENGSEAIVWRDGGSGGLNLSWFTTTYWVHETLIDSGVSEDFVVRTDAQGSLHVLHEANGIVADLIWPAMTTKVVDASNGVGAPFAVAISADGTEQLAYGADGGDSVRLVRSLEDRREGRLDPTASLWLDGDSEHGRTIVHGDFDGDGLEDVAIADPGRGNGKGAVDIHMGRLSGLSSVPHQSLLGGAEGDAFGSGLAAVKDLDGDGDDELLIGAPGALNQSGVETGIVQIHLGDRPLPDVADEIWYGLADGDEYGSSITSLGDVNLDGIDDWAVLSAERPSGSSGGRGQVDVYHGSHPLPNASNWTRTGSGENLRFGYSIAAVGDLDNDSSIDVAIGSAGELTDLVGYGRVDVYHGGLAGLGHARTYEMNQQGTLFGYAVAGAGDLDGDGYDDLAIGEPLNSSQSLGEGKVWLFRGGENGTAANPDLTIDGGTPNQRFGTAFASAGDIDGDGYGDLFIAKPGGNGGRGEIQLQFGSGTELLETQPNIWPGTANGTRQGTIIAPIGDTDADGQPEWVLGGWNSSGSSLSVHEQRDFEAMLLPTILRSTGDLIGLDLAADLRGRTHVLLTEQSSADPSISGVITTHMERPDELVNAASPWRTTSFDGVRGMMVIGQTGAVTLVVSTDLTGLSSVQAIHRSSFVWSDRVVATAASDGIPPSLAINSTGAIEMLSVENGSKIVLTTTTASGSYRDAFTTASAALSEAPMLRHDEDDRPVVIWRDPGDETLRHAVREGVDWKIRNLSMAGEATCGANCSWGATLLNGNETRAVHWNGSIHVVSSAEIGENGTAMANVSSPYLDGNLSAIEVARDDWLVATMDANGVGRLFVANESGGFDNRWMWNGSDQPATFIGTDLMIAGSIIDLSIGSGGNGSDGQATLPAGALRSCPTAMDLADCTILEATPPPSASSRTAAIRMADGGLLRAMTACVPVVGGLEDCHLSISSRESFTLPYEFSQHIRPALALGSDGTLHVALMGVGATSDVTLVRMLPDSDRDQVPDAIDALQHLGGQWNDADGDGWGDHTDGPLSDDCDDDSEQSRFDTIGCPDLDDDGYANSIDRCFDKGFSYWDRIGCPDHDADGWSTNDNDWIDGDRYTVNWMQSKDSDGDGLGDNHGPDCCGDMDPPDLFPLNPRQWADSDGDGFGDNETAFDGDKCPDFVGTSLHDRGGCLDSDGDGYSDPQDRSSSWADDGWYIEDGADAWPWGPDDTSAANICGSRCGEQWADSDGDGWGDNSTPGAWRRDAFPADPSQWNDTDHDGFGDNFDDANLTGERLIGVYHENASDFDACPLTNGNSTIDKLGCLDSDGDGHSNIYEYVVGEDGLRDNESGDALPDNPEQWRDKDGDGFGDIPHSSEGDQCPSQRGVANGIGGAGCPAPMDDADADLVADEDDLCDDTPQGAVVDADGCAWDQRDDDGDSVMNPDDLCQNTTANDSVDQNGCSAAQRSVDEDDDGVGDVYDLCPETDLGLTVDENGCAPNQLDSDGDGVTDDIDQCPDTAAGADVEEDGCYISGWDSDGDGFEDTNDAFPGDSSQWLDSDADGFGDNKSGNQSDDCNIAAGNSTEDRLGCPDTDGDGWSDSDVDWPLPPLGLADAFPEEPTQWRDRDGDGFGDNASEGAFQTDECPDQRGSINGNAGVGCPWFDTTDTDGDGVYDTDDLCPGSPSGVYVDPQGCTEDQALTGPVESTSAISPMMCGGIFGVLLVIGLLGLIISRLSNREFSLDDDDDDDYDDYDDYDDEEDSFSALGIGGGSAPPVMMAKDSSERGGISGGGGVAGPGPGGPPSRDVGPSGPPSRRGPPRRTPEAAAPAASSGGPPRRRSRRTMPGDSAEGGGEAKKVRRTAAVAPSDDAPARRVRRTKATPTSSDPYVQQFLDQGYSMADAEAHAARYRERAGIVPESADAAPSRPVRRTRTTKEDPGGGKSGGGSSPRKSASWDALFDPMQRRSYDDSLTATKEALASREEERTIMRRLQRQDGWTARQSRHILEEARR